MILCQECKIEMTVDIFSNATVKLVPEQVEIIAFVKT